MVKFFSSSLISLMLITQVSYASPLCSQNKVNLEVDQLLQKLWPHPVLKFLIEENLWTHEFGEMKCHEGAAHFIRVKGIFAITLAKLMGAHLPTRIWEQHNEQEVFMNNIYCSVGFVPALSDQGTWAEIKAGVQMLEMILSVDLKKSKTANERFAGSFCKIPLSI